MGTWKGTSPPAPWHRIHSTRSTRPGGGARAQRNQGANQARGLGAFHTSAEALAGVDSARASSFHVVVDGHRVRCRAVRACVCDEAQGI